MPTESGITLSRESRIHAEDLDVQRRSLQIVRDATVRPEVRRRLKGVGLQERLNQLLRTSGRRGLAIAAEELIDLANAGATPAELELWPRFLDDIVAELLKLGAEVDRRELEAAESEADVAEDALQDRALIYGETPVEKCARARALRLQGAAAFALARRLEQEARHEAMGLTRRVS